MFLMILLAGCTDSLVVKPGTPGDSAEVAGPPSADTADTAETGAAESAPADTVSADTAESVPPDGDGDGFTADEDCDDADATVSPGALEECDGRDDDCDGLVDDADSDVTGAPVWYRDADADGFGDSAGSVSSCSPPPGYVAVASDCDDSEAAVNPASTEVCDGLDNDCDALNDGRDPGCTDVTTWYADTDGDGYGDPADSRIACDGHGGWVTNGLDCDDTDPTLTTTCGGESTACSADGTAVACGGTFQCLDLCDAVNVDHTDGPWTGDPSESFDVAPGTVAWTTADRTVVPFLILDPAANEARSMIASRGGEDWRPSYGFPERFEIPGGGASGSRLHLAGLASGWSDCTLFAGVAGTLTIQFADGTTQVLELENGRNLDDWNSTAHDSCGPDAVRVYVDHTYGRHIDAQTIDLESDSVIDSITLVDDATVHTGTAEKTSIELFAITVEP